ncbi:MAG: VanZ family protein [Phascolarctobacterium sp.]|nr:VanZ family protein [Phascolarctobacterium sp.]
MKYLWLLLALAMMCLIWYNSSLPAVESGHLSGWAAGLVLKLTELTGTVAPSNLEHLIRKLAHFMEFAILGLLWCKTFADFRVSNHASTGYILLFCLLIAVLDEYIQLFSLGREGKVMDVLLDFSGSLCAWLWFRIVQWCE